jgi:ADP-ribosyl-[dinitrogen reductase] hydrolase
MIGAIIGDIAGSRYEFEGNRDPSVPLFADGCDFTDDSIMTAATAHAILYGGGYRDAYVTIGRSFPRPMGGYGGTLFVNFSFHKTASRTFWGPFLR